VGSCSKSQSPLLEFSPILITHSHTAQTEVSIPKAFTCSNKSKRSPPSIYVEDLEKAAAEGILNLEFENSYFFHTAFIHGHAHWPPLPAPGFGTDDKARERQFYGSVQPAVFDGPRVWSQELREMVEKCLVRIAPVMKSLGVTAPERESFT
jgi:hypothetical protein